MKPVIGITASYRKGKIQTALNHDYSEGIKLAGGIPVILPELTADMIDQIYNKFDGFLFSGGPDVDPVHYNEGILPCNGVIRGERDLYEIHLVNLCVEKKIPVLGICRGIQIINVALGGSLYQDINKQGATEYCHSQKNGGNNACHYIKTEKNTICNNLLGDEIRVNSFHHQAIKTLGEGLLATAYSADGLIEAVELKNEDFLHAVQWHPEKMWFNNQTMLTIAKDFIDKAQKYKRG